MALLLKKPKEELNTAFKNLFPTYYSQISRKHQPGIIMILSLVFMLVVLILSAALFTKTGSFVNFTDNSIEGERATGLAEAGVEYAIWNFNSGTTIDALNTEGPQDLGAGQFELDIVEDAGGRKITSTGCVPSCSAPQPKKRSIQIIAQEGETTFPLDKAAFVDLGGLWIAQNSSSSHSPSIIGNVFSNGIVYGNPARNWSINGDMETAVNIYEPQVCPKVTGACLDSEDGIEERELPEPNFTEMEVKAGASETTISGDYNKNCNFPFPKFHTLGNHHITGNLSMTNCDLTLTGPVWVEGTVTFIGGTLVHLSSSLTNEGTVIISDNKISVKDASVIRKETNPDRYIMLWSTKPGTSSDAVFYENSGSGGNVYAPYGQVNFEDSADIIAVTAYKVIVNYDADVSYEEGLAEATYNVGENESTSWTLLKGSYNYVDPQ